VVVYKLASNTLLARFNLGAAKSTSLGLGASDLAYIGFGAIAHAQDSTDDYYFASNSPVRFILSNNTEKNRAFLRRNRMI